MAVAVMLALCLAGCGSADSNGGSGASSKAPEIDIEDVGWELDRGKVDGYRVVTVDVENNTPYDIVAFSLSFVPSDETTDEDLNDIGELKEKARDMDEEIEDMTFECISERYIKSGEKADDLGCTLDDTIEYLTSYSATKLFEPETLDISYVADGRIYSAEYDYNEDEMDYDDDSVKAVKWSDSKLTSNLPKPDAPVITVDDDSEDSFTADVYGVDNAFFESYIDACKEKGYTKNINAYEDSFSAEDEDGNSLDLSYYDTDNQINISLTKK